MNFISLYYALFLLIVYVLYWKFFYKKNRQIFLLASSLCFYGLSDYRSLVFLIAAIVVTYAGARILEKTRNRKLYNIVFISCLFLIVSMLCVFKYPSHWLKGNASTLSLTGVFLPAGISFYTFQCLSYLIDVYKKKTESEKNIITFALFISFFPQLVAGPIEKADHLIPQLNAEPVFDRERQSYGWYRIVLGYYKKVVLSFFAALFCDKVFADLSSASGIQTLTAIIAFGFEIYLDFSGYSDIALGSARLLGIDLTENFNKPYRASSIRDFWSRWHMSLNCWLKEYIYINLGGNKKGGFRTYINVLAVFLLSGLWHGFKWNYLLWAFVNAVFVIAEKIIFGKKKIDNPLYRAFTLIVVFISWGIFRLENTSDLGILFTNIFCKWKITDFMALWTQSGLSVLKLFIYAAFAVIYLAVNRVRKLRPWQSFILINLIIGSYVYAFNNGMVNAFIYFRF